MFTKLKSSKSKRFGLKEGVVDDAESLPSQHSIVRDALAYDNQFSEREIWEGHKKIFHIINKLKGSLPLINDGARVKFNFPSTIPEFVGLATKYHQPNRLLPAATIISDVLRRVKVEPSKFSLITQSGIVVGDDQDLSAFGLGTLYDNWELELIPKASLDARHSKIDLEEEEASLRLLVIVNYPPEFGGLAKGAHKLDIFVPVEKHIAQICQMKQTDPSQFTFTTLDGLTLQVDQPLCTYGLGARFSQWELKLQSKSQVPPPAVLHSTGLLWALVSDSLTLAREVSSIVTNFDLQVTDKVKEIEELGNSNEELKQTNEQNHLNIAQLQSQVKGLSETVSLRDNTEHRLEGEIDDLRKELSAERTQKENIQSKVASLEQSLALAEFTVNLMEDKRGKDEELAQLKRKFETELETYKQLLGIFFECRILRNSSSESTHRSKIQAEVELEERVNKESVSREHLEKAGNIAKAEWKRECEKWRIEKNDLMQKWTREKAAVEAEVKKRKGLEIDKSRLEREILELQRRADRERTKREELESRWSEDSTSAVRFLPTSPISPPNTLVSFSLLDKVPEDGVMEDDVATKRLRIERGEYERELETLRKENELLKKESEQRKRDKRRKYVDTEKGERQYNTLDRNYASPKLDKDEDAKLDARRKLSWDLDRDRDSPEGARYSSADMRRKSFGERDDHVDRDDGVAGAERPVERRRWDMEREIEKEKWKKQGQLEKDYERSKWKQEKDKELDRLKKYQELEKGSLLKEKEQLRTEKDKYINDLRLRLEEQIVKVQMWEEEVTELTKQLKDRELDRLREAAKAERERSGKQLEEQEREIMRLKTLLHGEKSEWYRMMDQEKAKMKADRSNELEALQKDLDAKRVELKAHGREMSLERHKMEQERLRYQEDRDMWKKEIDVCEERVRKKDAEIAKIQSDVFELQQAKYKLDKEEIRISVEDRAGALLNGREKEERPRLVRRFSREQLDVTRTERERSGSITSMNNDEKNVVGKTPPSPAKTKEVDSENEPKKSPTERHSQSKLEEELHQREGELSALLKSYDEEKTSLKEHELKVKMWEEEVEELEKAHREERDKELKNLKESHSKEIKKWERAAEEALARLNTEKSSELKTLKDAVKQKLVKNEKTHRKQMELLAALQQKYAQQSLEFSILQGEHTIQKEELATLRDKYWKETREWDTKWSAKETETEKMKSQYKNELQQLQLDADSQRKAMDEELSFVMGKLEDVQIQLQTEIKRLETENMLLQQIALREKDNATLVARQWADKERKAAEVEKRQWKKDEQKREEERNTREKDWISKLTAKFKEIERIIAEDYADSGGGTEETAERLLRRMEHIRMLLLADKKPKKKPKPTTTSAAATSTASNINNNNSIPNNNTINNINTITTINNNSSPDCHQTGNDTTTNSTPPNKETIIAAGPHDLPFVFHNEAQPTITAADLLEKNLDTVLRELQHSKANHKELATQVWDLRRQLGDARKYFEKTLHQYEEEANFNMQHLRRSYEEQMDLLKAEAKRANRLLEQTLNRHTQAHLHPHAVLSTPPPPQNIPPTVQPPATSIPPPNNATTSNTTDLPATVNNNQPP